MRVIIVDNGTSFLERLESLFTEGEVTVVGREYLSKIKSGDADLVVLSGGHGLPVMNKSNPYANEIEFIKNYQFPILGVCLGYELIGRAFGAELKLMENPEKGILAISPIREHELFRFFCL